MSYDYYIYEQLSSNRVYSSACDKAAEAAKQGANQAKKVGEEAKFQATAAAENVLINFYSLIYLYIVCVCVFVT